MGDGDAVADAGTHNLFALKYGLQDFFTVHNGVVDRERVNQLGDDILFGFSLEVDNRRIG